MTTSNPDSRRDNAGANTTVTQQGVWVGATADVKLMDMMVSTKPEHTYQPIVRLREDAHDIGLGDLVVTKNEELFKKYAGASMSLHDSRSFGRLLAFGQHGNFPIGDIKEQPYAKTLSVDDKQELARQRLLQMVSFLGVSQDSFRKQLGADQTPLHDGIAVLIRGFVTVGQLNTGTQIPPMSPLVLAVSPMSQPGRGGGLKYQSDGAEKYRFTLAAFDHRTPIAYLMSCIDMLHTHLTVTPAPYTSGALFKYLSDFRDGNMLYEHRIAASIVFGFLGFAVAKVTGSPPMDNVIFDVIKTITEKNPRAPHGYTDAQPFMGPAGLVFVMNACLDVASRSNRVVGKCVQSQLPKYGKSNSGLYDYDCLFY